MTKNAATRWLSPFAIKTALVVIALGGVVAIVLVLTSSEADPLEAIAGDWRLLLGPAALYAAGLGLYSYAWASLFGESEDRRLIALGFLVSQPAKYLPGGFAQPVGQVGLATQATRSPRQVLVRFPVHVLLNVVATLTLASYLLFTPNLPGWAAWFIVVVPLAWLSLNRRWMSALLALLGRKLKRFRLSGDLPSQSSIFSAFGVTLGAHALMAASFAVLVQPALASRTLLESAAAYAAAWVVGYLILPAPAGLGVREGAIVFLFAGSLSAVDAVRIATAHRVLIVVVELVIMATAFGVLWQRWTTPSASD